MKLIKLKSGDTALIGSSKIKEGDYFVEMPPKESGRQSYAGIIYRCDGFGFGFIYSKEINFPFPENCRKVIYSTTHFKFDWALLKDLSQIFILATGIFAGLTWFCATQYKPDVSSRLIFLPIISYLFFIIISVVLFRNRFKL